MTESDSWRSEAPARPNYWIYSTDEFVTPMFLFTSDDRGLLLRWSKNDWVRTHRTVVDLSMSLDFYGVSDDYAKSWMAGDEEIRTTPLAPPEEK